MIFNSKFLGVTAWIFLGNRFVSQLKTVSMYWRIGLPKNSSRAGISRLSSAYQDTTLWLKAQAL
jgi:hypothetical protein